MGAGGFRKIIVAIESNMETGSGISGGVDQSTHVRVSITGNEEGPMSLEERSVVNDKSEFAKRPLLFFLCRSDVVSHCYCSIGTRDMMLKIKSTVWLGCSINESGTLA